MSIALSLTETRYVRSENGVLILKSRVAFPNTSVAAIQCFGFTTAILGRFTKIPTTIPGLIRRVRLNQAILRSGDKNNHNPPEGNNEDTLSPCTCRIGNQLCFADFCPTKRDGRSKNCPGDSCVGYEV